MTPEITAWSWFFTLLIFVVAAYRIGRNHGYQEGLRAGIIEARGCFEPGK